MTTKTLTRLASTFILLFIPLFCSSIVLAGSIKGIYITQSTLENTKLITYLIENAKKTGINTFVIDMEKPGKLYEKNIALVNQSGIKYVARITMFPDGGTPQQISDEAYWKRKYKLMTAAIDYGAKEIQMDYIRYNTRSGSSPEHSKNVYKIVSWYKNQLEPQKIPLQIDVFGISSYGEEPHIGQNIPMIAKTVDTVCPMVYPSHYTPFKQHFATPYQTVYDSLSKIKKMFPENMPVKLVAYIELSNYHYPLSHNKKMEYIQAQLKAVKDSGSDGWFAWSPHNHYDTLFEVLGDTNVGEEKKAVAENTVEAKETADKKDIAENKETTEKNITDKKDLAETKATENQTTN